jgi:uncharacterized protein (DUF302 family)
MIATPSVAARSWLLIFFCLGACQPAQEQLTPRREADYRDSLYARTTDKSFADVEWELEFAISERNFRITGKNSVGSGLRDRGYTDFPNAAVVHFCSLERAREVLLMDLGFLAVMPCRIAIYEEGDGVTIAAVMLPTGHTNPDVTAFAREFNELQREIVDFVVDDRL